MASVDRLLDLLSHILSGQPYKPLGAPPNLTRPDVNPIARDMTTQVNGVEKSQEITLALTTLGSFDFTGLCSPYRRNTC